MKVFVFPGQGSQRKGMGGELFDTVPQFSEVESQIDLQLGYSLRTLCLCDADNLLKETQYTQPALFVVSALHYFKALSEHGPPAAVAGHSLGEYNALLAAGAFDLLTGVKLVQRRGWLMAQAPSGGMAAVVGLEVARVIATLREAGLASLDVANYNAPLQTVVSGPSQEITRALPIFERAGATMCVPLPVSAAFHSRYMEAVARQYAEFLSNFTFQAPKIPVIANVTARPYPSGIDGIALYPLLLQQITRPVLWTQSIRALCELGATEFIEAGPGTVLTRLVQQIRAG
jgi:malonyl CoA-acyl carrier protein transacylase